MGFVAIDRAMLGIPPEVVAKDNDRLMAAHLADYAALAARLARENIDIEDIVAKVMALEVGLPSWGMVSGGTRFARFPLPGEPTDVFEKLDDAAVLTAFLAAHADHDRYVIDYIDYRSADGFFRKYRFLFVGNEILPYHLAVGDHWKLHRDATEMGHHTWMQDEEEQFLRAPEQIFGPSHYQALRVIRDCIALDYFGIDCGLDTNGHLVVFEVNASMLVHDQNPEFPYKDRYIHRIKLAFDGMLARLARGN